MKTRPAVIAHRGTAAEAPENTIEAFDLSVQLGADALELDVQRAGDGTLVVIHDPTVDRTTKASGAVADLTASALGQLGVPALAEVLRRYDELEITVDVKDVSATAEVVSLIEDLGRVERTILYVEDGTGAPAFASYAGRRATSTAQAAWLAGRVRVAEGDGPQSLPPGFPEVVHTPLAGPDGPIVSERFILGAHRSGRSVQVWTIDDPAGMRELRRWGVDGIITNDVRRAVSLLKENDETS